MSMRERSRSPVSYCEDEEDQRFDKQRWDKKSRSRSPISSNGEGGELCVSNVPYEVKWQELKDIFRNEVGSVKHVDLFNNESGKPNGTGVITFESKKLAIKAVELMDRYEIQGRKIRVKMASEVSQDKESRFSGKKNLSRPIQTNERNIERRISREPDRVTKPYGVTNTNSKVPFKGETYGLSLEFLENLGIVGPLVNKVFVSNLDYKVTETNLEEVFQVAGKVVDINLNKDSNGKSKGYGVIEFAHPIHAVQSVSMLNDQSYFDRKLIVRLDRASVKSTNPSVSKLPKGLKSLGMGLGVNGLPMTDIPPNNCLPTDMNSRSMDLPSGSGTMGLSTDGNMGLSSRNSMGMSGGNLGLSSENMGLPSGNMGLSSGNMGLSSGNIGLSSGNMGLCSDNSMGLSGGNLTIRSGSALGLSTGTMGLSARGSIGYRGGSLDMRSPSLSMPSRYDMSGDCLLPMSDRMSMATNNYRLQDNMMGMHNMSLRNDVRNMVAFDTPNRMTSSSLGVGTNRIDSIGNTQFSQNMSMTSRDSFNMSTQSQQRGRTIIRVSNLPLDYTWQRLRDLCRDYGDIKFAELKTKGVGLVRFSNEAEAIRAADMLDRQRLDGRLLDAVVA